MSAAEIRSPVIAVLFDADEGPPPGLDVVDGEATIRYATDAAGLAAALDDADILLVTDFRTHALHEAWSAARRLRWIHATSAGVDAVLIPEVVASEIPVTNARGLFDRGIAEYVLGAVLLFFQHVVWTIRDMHVALTGREMIE